MICECCNDKQAEQYLTVEEMFVCDECMQGFIEETQEDVKVGRPTIGETKKVSITLPKEDWFLLDQFQKKFSIKSRSQLLRIIIREFLEEIQSEDILL
jgi:hypothetical protein